jgi:hypothetical protein
MQLYCRYHSIHDPLLCGMSDVLCVYGLHQSIWWLHELLHLLLHTICSAVRTMACRVGTGIPRIRGAEYLLHKLCASLEYVVLSTYCTSCVRP